MMKVYYDDEVDALYLKLGDETPEGVIEISEGVNLDTTSEDKIVGIEILEASKKIDLKTILSYTLEFDKELVIQKLPNKSLQIQKKNWGQEADGRKVVGGKGSYELRETNVSYKPALGVENGVLSL